MALSRSGLPGRLIRCEIYPEINAYAPGVIGYGGICGDINSEMGDEINPFARRLIISGLPFRGRPLACLPAGSFGSDLSLSRRIYLNGRFTDL